jgi:ATP:ADP antiporter, AAA family
LRVYKWEFYMYALKRFWRSLFDIRPGEYARTLFMALYLMLVLFAYYILKPVSRALFLNNFDIDKLPWLYVLIAAIGGVLAYLYTKMAVRSSLSRAVDLANIFCTGVLVLFWWLIQLKASWVIYAFNIWVSLFSIILVSQGWLVAANVYTPREAKRLYGILGVGSVIGAAFGGQFTAVMVYYIGTTNLLLASAGMVVLSYIAYRFAIAASGKTLKAAKGAEAPEEFTFAEIAGAIRRTRHLQVIIAIISITFIVDVLVEFQFSAMAKNAYHGRDLTAFLGNFYGFWLNLVTFILQLFLTSFVVTRFGVGGTLQIMPVSIALASIAALVSPTLLSTAAARLTEASTRYSFNKTGMELLYLPLPLELRNRTKAFVDVFVDRLSRGIGGMILVFFTSVIALKFAYFAIVVMVFSVLWIFLSLLAKREYIATVRHRIESRRLDFESARIAVSDPATLSLLERTARGDHPRQAAYALRLLSDAPGYDAMPLATELSSASNAEVRGAAYNTLRANRDPRALDAALAEIRNARGKASSATVREAVLYALAVAPDPAALSRQLLDHENAEVRAATVESLAAHPDVAQALFSEQRIWELADSRAAEDRRLAAIAIRATGGRRADHLERLLGDPDSQVISEAMRTAGALQRRDSLSALFRRLGNTHLRGGAIDALACFGARITGTLGDLIADDTLDLAIRRQAPRVLARIKDQRAVDVLTQSARNKNLMLRGASLKALNKLREAAPELNYQAVWLAEQIHEEARTYFELYLALASLRELESPKPATDLLSRTLEARLGYTLERVFRLLGLKYPPKQIYAAYVAVHRRGENFPAAIEFLDNILDRELKRILLPLLDESGMLAQRAHELFRIERKTVADALRELMRSGDPWLAACSIAVAAELRMRDVAADIREVGAESGRDVADVARAAEVALA